MLKKQFKSYEKFEEALREMSHDPDFMPVNKNTTLEEMREEAVHWKCEYIRERNNQPTLTFLEEEEFDEALRD